MVPLKQSTKAPIAHRLAYPEYVRRHHVCLIRIFVHISHKIGSSYNSARLEQERVRAQKRATVLFRKCLLSHSVQFNRCRSFPLGAGFLY